MDFKRFLGRYWLIKLFLFATSFLLRVFHFPYLYYFYFRQLKNAPPQRQLFFQSRQEHGAILVLLYYIRCWTNVRNGTVLVVFNPQYALIKKLAQQICPTAHIICPPVFLSNFVQKSLSGFMNKSVFPPLYNHFLRKYPDAVYIYGMEGSQWPYVKHLDNVYKNRPHDSPFWDAYVQTMKEFDCRFDVNQDFFQLAEVSRGISVDELLVRGLLNDLEIPGKYVVININIKDYSNQNDNIQHPVNFFAVKHFERYNVLIDHLINNGYSVVLQGTGEQPHFSPREGFIDYAHSVFQSVKNDFLLFGGCEFFVSSKTGAEWYGLICDKPVLGLNYTELPLMQPCIRFRFFPKHIRDETGKHLSWRKVLTHPVFFQIGKSLPTQETFEFVEMEEHEIIAAVDEFLQLLLKPREQWLNYSLLQSEFKQMLHPAHMDLYHISGVPCEAYLKEDAKVPSA